MKYFILIFFIIGLMVSLFFYGVYVGRMEEKQKYLNTLNSDYIESYIDFEKAAEIENSNFFNFSSCDK